MEKNSLKIVGFGLIGEDKKGLYRQIIFEDMDKQVTTEFLLYKTERPGLWRDVENMEDEKTSFEYNGKIVKHKGVDIVLLGDESPEDAFEQQKWKQNPKKKLSQNDLLKKIDESCGFITDKTRDGTMEMAWSKLEEDILKIKFRYYEGEGNFIWSEWYEVK